jgi:hypothetical protein
MEDNIRKPNESTPLEVVELLIDEENDLPGVFAISLVESPAIESNFIALSKQDIKLQIVDAEKRLVIGLALIPDKEILRKRGDYEYNIRFSSETVRKASQLYLKEMRNKNTTYEHEEIVDGVYLCESWIVEDAKMDKTALYGIEATVGSWAIGMKVDNDDVWQRIKAGEVLGFSIEGLFDEKKVDVWRAKWEQIKRIVDGE